MVLDFCPFGCLLSSFSAAFCRTPSFWLPFVFSLAALLGPLLFPQSLKYWFWNLWFWISVLLAAFFPPFRLLFVDFRAFGCLLSSLWLPCWARCSFRSPFNIGFEIYGFGFLSFWLPFVFLFGCFLSISVLLAAFCLLFGCLVGPAAFLQSLKYWFWNLWFWISVLLAAFFSSFSAAFCRFPSFWLPFVFSLAALLGPLLFPQSLKYWFWNLWFWISVLLAAFCLPFRLLFVDFRPFGCLLSSLWLPCWARCSLRSPLNIGFEIYGFGFLSFWLPFVFLFGCFLSISVLLAAFCFLFRLLFVEVRPFGCLFVFSLAALLGPLLFLQSLKYWFWNLWFWISVLLAAFCLPFRLLFVDFRPFGCLLFPFSAAFCRIPSFWLPFVFSLAAFWACSFLRSPLNIGFEIYGFGFLSFWLPFVCLFGCFLSISVLLAAFCLLFGCLVGPAALSAVP